MGSDYARVHLDGTVFGSAVDSDAADLLDCQTHAVERTSAKGTPFVGTCINCGLEGLDIASAQDECPNHAGRSAEDTLLAVIEPQEVDRG